MKKLNIFLFLTLFAILSFCFVNKSFAQTTIAGANDYIKSLIIQPDGKIIIGGSFTSYNGIERRGIARLNVDGSLDESFNPQFREILDANNSIYKLVIQRDGKILILNGGYTEDFSMESYLTRLNSDGSPDTSFNPGVGVNGYIQSLNIQSDGKIIIGGIFTSYNGIERKGVARLNVDGSLDESFNFNNETNRQIYGLGIQNDGKIIISDWNFLNSTTTTLSKIIRLNTDGSLDTSFTSEINESEFLYVPYVQSNGKIIFLGKNSSGNKSSIVKMNSDGSLDINFHLGTIIKLIKILNQQNEGYSSIEDLKVQSDGKIIIGGIFTSYNGIERRGIARLNVDGSLDESFNANTLIDGYDSVNILNILSDNKILAVLSEGLIADRYAHPIVNPLVKLNSGGSLDTSFGSTRNNTVNPPTTVIKPTITQSATTKLRGQLLLQVEDHGRIWYVSLDGKRYEVTFANALPLFKKLSLGITNKDLSGIPLSTEIRTSAIGNRLKGKLLLQVEDKGRIWYVDLNGRRHEVTWNNLMDLFRKLSLGITNADLNKITIGEIQIDNTDTDKDGLTDLQEIIYKTDPNNPDTDGDGYLDGNEVEHGYDPTIAGGARL